MHNRSAVSDGPSGTIYVRPADVCSSYTDVCLDREDVCMDCEDVCSDCADVCSAPCPFKATTRLLPACLLHQKLLGVATGSGDSATHVASGGMTSGEVVAQQLRNRLSNPI
ncbi:unnamed protein product [Arabidopsis lyrata]|uniref:Predicted protein n=1 Tax=Arabidopsis lyrata subsp. lyrata TaxID=81972 RepID=D7LES6_ARALL|nr:predicted protein [Arabidopsis lyrata subsp. lyrata]CAH8263753.1 unnamed protein product [Arabidopsis lyrata]